MAGSFNGIPVAFMGFSLARAKRVRLVRTAPLVKATWELALKATQQARFAEVTVVLRLVAQNPPALGKLQLDSLELSGRLASQSDRLTRVSFAPAPQRSIPSRG
jgi:hypothetical protein